MIIGIGVDMVDVARVQRLYDRFGEKFTHKVFTEGERGYAEQSFHPLRAYANRFAAKEAALKAIGTGKRDGIRWHDVEIFRASSGAPSLSIQGKAYEHLMKRIVPGHQLNAHVSFSDEPPYSIAFVILSGVQR